MTIVDKGSGTPVVLVPSIQGRWEYLAPTVDALSRSLRVITFSLADESSADRRHWSLDDFAAQVEHALDDRGIRRAVICGVSFGGRIALRFAASHPERTSALILASVPGPDWRLRPSHRLYTRLPWLFAPLFAAGAPLRLRRELVAAFPDPRERRRFSRWMIGLLVRKPLSPRRLATRGLLIDGVSSLADCERVTAPTLVVTGEPSLDHVVPAAGTASYARLISGARAMCLEDTGHLGSVTRPARFAQMAVDFIEGTRVSSSGSNEDAA